MAFSCPASVLVAFAFLNACGPKSAATSLPKPRVASPRVAASGPVYRFVAPRGRRRMEEQPLADGGVGVVGFARARVSADGAVEFAASISGDSLMGGVPIPERLGAGFLFWSSHGLYRARTFVGDLQPVA